MCGWSRAVHILRIQVSAQLKQQDYLEFDIDSSKLLFISFGSQRSYGFIVSIPTINLSS